MGESANTPSGDQGNKKLYPIVAPSLSSEIGKLGEVIKEGLLPSPKLQNKEMSSGDKLTKEQWRNPETRARILEAATNFKNAPEGSNEQIKYKVIEDTLKRLLGVNLGAEIEEKSLRDKAEKEMTAALDPDADEPFLDDMPAASELFINKEQNNE